MNNADEQDKLKRLLIFVTYRVLHECIIRETNAPLCRSIKLTLALQGVKHLQRSVCMTITCTRTLL